MKDDFEKSNRFDCKILTYKLDHVNYKKIESDIEEFCNESTWEYRCISQLSTTVDSNHNLYIVNAARSRAHQKGMQDPVRVRRTEQEQSRYDHKRAVKRDR